MATPTQEKEMRVLASALSGLINEIYGTPMVFMINIATPGDSGISDYISNGNREDCMAWMKETISRFEATELIPAAE